MTSQTDAIQFLKQEHQKAKAAFGKLLAAPPARRGELWEEIQPELKAHEEMEDACLYGPLAEERPSDAKLSEWVSDRHEEEVAEVESLIEKTKRLDPRDDRWFATIQQIHTALESHIRREEGDIFPRISKAWDHARLAKVAEEMSGMKGDKAGATS
jgi:iron-sulfur cluster repair protein YtfE (RIC family)